MQVQCPHCGKKLDSPEGQPGQVVQCGSCGGQMQLPAVTESAPDVAAPQVYGGGLSRPGQKRCPHCGEGVVGDEPRCPHCDTVFSDGPQARERRGPDWEQRHRLGWWPGFWGTTKGVLFNPTATFDDAKLTGYGPAFSYALICSYIGVGAAMLWQIPFQLLPLLSRRPSGPEPFIIIGMIVAMAVIMPPIAAAMQFVSAAFTHLGLMLLKGASQSYEATYRAIAYGGSAPGLLAVVPICGGYIGNIWGIVTSVIALARMHKTEWWRALIAIFLIPTALAVVMVVLVLVIVAIVAALN